MWLITVSAGVGCVEGGAQPVISGEPPEDTRFIMAGAPAEAAIDSGLRAELGVQDTVSDLGFATLDDGAPIPFAGTGQAGLTARLAVKLSAEPGVPMPGEVLLDVVLEDVETGDQAVNSSGIPVRLTCDGDACYRAPVLVQVSHLGEGVEGVLVDGLLVVRDASDPERVLATAECHGRLERR